MDYKFVFIAFRALIDMIVVIQRVLRAHAV